MTLDEVKEAIKELKNIKAAGKDQHPDELLKHCSELLYEVLHHIMSKIWEDEELSAN